MARRSRKPVLPGQSRSAACTATEGCGRLSQHRGDCRPTLSARGIAKPKASVVRPDVLKDIERVEAILARLRREAALPKAVKQARRPKVAKTCRISRDGVRCDRAYGHKAEGLRHRFTGRVVNLPEGESRRMVADSANGGHRTARRPKAAPRISAEA